MENTLLAVTAALGLAVIALVAVLLSMEAVFQFSGWFKRRFVYDMVRRQDYLDPRYHPYLDWITDWRKPMFQYLPIGLRHFNTDNPIAPVRNNTLGFRCDELSEPSPEEFRIAVIGGSAAWGCGASSNDATIAGQLECIANEDGGLSSGRRVKVFNLAQVDAHQTQDLLTVVLFLDRLQPDIVVSLTGWNEVACNFTMRRDVLKTYGVFYLLEMYGWQPINAGDNAYRQMCEGALIWAAKRSALADRLKARRDRIKAQPRRPMGECVALAEPLFLRNLERLQKLAAGFGFEHFQFLQPHLYRKPRMTPEEAKAIELYDEVRPVQGGKEAGDFLRSVNIYNGIVRQARAEPERYGPVVDLSDLFMDEPEQMFFSLVHCTDAGYRRVAECMYETLRASSRAATA